VGAKIEALAVHLLPRTPGTTAATMVYVEVNSPANADGRHHTVVIEAEKHCHHLGEPCLTTFWAMRA
jgi:hypothetical protein